MLKKSLFILTFGSLLMACGSNHQYHLNSYEKQGQKGFHATQAKKIIDKNEQNKDANKKAAEKQRQQQNATAAANAAANSKSKKSGQKHSGVFKFY